MNISGNHQCLQCKAFKPAKSFYLDWEETGPFTSQCKQCADEEKQLRAKCRRKS